MLKSVSSIFLFVSDIKQSRDWYEKALGFKPRYEDPDFALFEVGKTNLCFHRADSKSPLTTGGCVGYWWVDDFRGAVVHLSSLGGTIYRGPIPTEANLQICQIKDPFGNVIGLEGEIQK
ncbi:MAG: VOC family protein [Oligoflexales bacterium]